jgi:uncharacterized HAD superfamily protein
MNYKSVSDMNRDILSWMSALPKDIDVVVGIPRGGLLAASMIALYMNKPLADIDGFLQGRVMGTGMRGMYLEKAVYKRILVVDDSVFTGRAMREAREKLAAAGKDLTFIFASPYVGQESAALVDLYFQVLPIPRLFEWGIFHHPVLENSCMDIDGILCRDPELRENDDGPAYREFISTVPVKIRPSVRVKWLVTSRLEKYRNLTRDWLAANRIPYENLVMLDLPDQATRMRLDAGAAFKARTYSGTKAVMFFESSRTEALKVASLCNKAVICTDDGSMVFPGDYAAMRKAAQNIYQILKGRAKQFLFSAAGKLSGTGRRG